MDRYNGLEVAASSGCTGFEQCAMSGASNTLFPSNESICWYDVVHCCVSVEILECARLWPAEEREYFFCRHYADNVN